MSADAHSPHDDLAFLRAVVEAGEDGQGLFGRIYFIAGLIYGGQMLAHAGQWFGWLGGTGLAGLLIGFGPTAVFLAVLTWILRGHPAAAPTAAARAMAAVFSAIALSNLVLVGIIGAVAWRQHSFTTWLIYPCTVFVLQAAGWLTSAMLRRRPWHGLVAAGWFAAGLAMAWSVASLGLYILFAGLGFLACMAAPGWVMMRLSRRGA